MIQIIFSRQHISSINHPEPPSFIQKLAEQSVRAGQQLTLTAKVKGSEPITVSWVQDKDLILRDGDNSTISFLNGEATLTVPTADHTTSGKYTCQLRNDSGQAECVSLVTVLGLYTIGLNILHFRSSIFSYRIQLFLPVLS